MPSWLLRCLTDLHTPTLSFETWCLESDPFLLADFFFTGLAAMQVLEGVSREDWLFLPILPLGSRWFWLKTSVPIVRRLFSKTTLGGRDNWAQLRLPVSSDVDYCTSPATREGLEPENPKFWKMIFLNPQPSQSKHNGCPERIGTFILEGLSRLEQRCGTDNLIFMGPDDFFWILKSEEENG